MRETWFTVFIFLAGFAIAFYWPSTGDMTIGKVFPR